MSYPVEYLPPRRQPDSGARSRLGQARDGGSAVDAVFAHIITLRGGRVAVLQPITDTASWGVRSAL
jgi:ketosteroid isomerase-like protein